MDKGAMPRIGGATAVGSRWQEMCIPFLVLHGLEGYPDRLGRDLDILMDQSNADIALREAGALLEGLGWQTAFPPDTWGKRLVALRPKGGGEFDYLEFHTVGSVQWVVGPLVSPSESALRTIGPFPVSDWATFMKELIAPVLAGDTSRYTDRYLDHHVGSSIRIEAIETRCRDYFGTELGSALIQGLVDRDPRRFLENRVPLRRLLIARMLRHPVTSMRHTPAFLKKKGPKPRSGFQVVMETPPKPEMDLLVESLVDKLDNVFVEINVRDSESEPLTAGERSRLRARQSLSIDHRTSAAMTESGRLRANSATSGANPPPFDERLDDGNLSDVSGRLAEWVVATWIEKWTKPTSI